MGDYIKLTDVGRDSVIYINSAQIKDHWGVMETGLGIRLKKWGSPWGAERLLAYPVQKISAPRNYSNVEKSVRRIMLYALFFSDILRLNISVKTCGLRVVSFRGLKFNSGFLCGVYIDSSTIRNEVG
jgi:hypothetical protein